MTPPYRVILRETDKFVEWRWSTMQSSPPSRDKKFLCIGGPFAGQRKASVQIANEDYTSYNAANRSRKTPHLTHIYVHRSLLP